jgi:hypothetical protein
LRFRSLILCGLATVGLFACGREPVAHGPSTLAMTFDTTRGAAAARVIVVGVDSANLRALGATTRSNDEWARILHVSVVGSDLPVTGNYSADNGVVVFQPAFPFDRGRAYTIRFDPRSLPVPRRDSALTIVAGLPRERTLTATTVVGMLPTADTVPENVLRMYIEFSAPMSRQPGVGFIHLIDDGGNEVKNAFLPLDADFWNPEHTRYTVFFDPGRVKRGIRPNEQLGRALHAGRPYALRIDSTWKDANGSPLAHPFRHEFWAGAAVQAPIVPAEWKVQPPRAGSRDALVVRFPRSLDRGLLQRALGVRTRGGQHITGAMTVGPQETEWRFIPRSPWTPGAYDLVVLSILEDVAGNRVGRAFEVDEFTTVDSLGTSEEHTVPFRIR